VCPAITYKDVIYKVADEEPVQLDIYMPKERTYEKHPLFVFIHGGGWKEGDKRENLRPSTWGYIFEQLTACGFAAASINYRLLVGRNAANVHAPVTDCKDALRWFAKHSGTYQLDMDRVIVGGTSAGAHLALMAGLTDAAMFPGDPQLFGYRAKVRAIVSWYGVTNLTKMGDQARRPPGWGTEQWNETLAELSPITYLSPKAPPMLLFHGTDDLVVPCTQSADFYEAGKALGADIRYIPVLHADHSYRQSSGNPIEPSLEEIRAATLDFIRQF